MADKKLKVYCETSFWFYLTGRQTDDEKIARWQALTLKWWREFASRCDIYISQHVQMESSDGGVEAVIAKNGFDCPIIITPEEFLARKEEFAL